VGHNGGGFQIERGPPRAGLRPVSLRFQTGLTRKQYVSRRAWRDASRACCPLHPRGNCSFARHGTYERVSPPGTRIPRWYCPPGHGTFSLLTDCFASRLSGTLPELEAVVLAVDQAKGLEAAASRQCIPRCTSSWAYSLICSPAVCPPWPRSPNAWRSTLCWWHCGRSPPRISPLCLHRSDSSPHHTQAVDIKVPSNTKRGQTRPQPCGSVSQHPIQRSRPEGRCHERPRYRPPP
jgi:hypothetical protein